ncbi:PREDICTED: uncharacterized protein LOC106106398 [Papilio polytes]|uniref:uncharacterized protein LOC106106398 n=1 Tax=Papilio polytes TaxID=76194 RepID=UPI0006769900|nr:PREDICTED: uncharacterized protein LOC106106398 [Papilio polytes]
MGYKLIILLGLSLGVLYCIHILVQDYQAVTASKLLRFLFKRDISSHNYTRPSVRWRKILMYDRIQCARFLYCTLGAATAAAGPDGEIRRGLILMLSLDPRDEDKDSLEVFETAYEFGRKAHDEINCRKMFPMCPFKSSFLLDIIKYLLGRNYNIM